MTTDTLTKLQPAILYVRVSTEAQATEDNALDRQLEKLTSTCTKHKFKPVAVYREIASVGDPGSLSRRPELQEALARAQSEGAILMINEPTRLFRVVSDARRFHKDFPQIRVFSVRHDRIIGRKTLLDEVGRGEKMIENTRSGTKSNLVGVDRTRKAPEVALGRKKGTEQSAKVRSETSEEITDCFVAVLKELPPGSKPTAAEVAELLNQRGITTSRGNKWHKDNVRHHLRKAKEKLRQIREAPEAETPRAEFDAPRMSSEEWDEMSSNPEFGMF